MKPRIHGRIIFAIRMAFGDDGWPWKMTTAATQNSWGQRNRETCELSVYCI